MILLVLRIVWQVYPGVFTCLAFWAVALISGVHDDAPGRWVWLTGTACNALVTLANGGYMPVLGPEGKNAFSLWVSGGESHRLLWLADRFWGFSIGDFFIGAGLLIYFVSTLLKHPAPTP